MESMFLNIKCSKQGKYDLSSSQYYQIYSQPVPFIYILFLTQHKKDATNPAMGHMKEPVILDLIK